MSQESQYTAEIADSICDQIAEGISLRAICRVEGMPCKATVFKWLRQQPEFADQYARAREDQADALADDLLEISDDSAKDFIQTENGPAFNAEHVQRSKLRVDTRKWIASKLKPKKYGDKIDAKVEHSGSIAVHAFKHDESL